MNRKYTSRCALFVIKLYSVFAIAILAVLLGYLFGRGLFSQTQKELPLAPIEDIDTEYAIFAHKKTHLYSIDWFTLKNIADKKITTFRSLSQVNKKINLFIDESIADSFFASLNLAVDKSLVYSKEQLIEKSRKKNNGAIIILPSQERLKRSFKKISFFDTVVVVQEGVLQLSNNKRISSLSKKDFLRLQDNSLKRWSEIGGPDFLVDKDGYRYKIMKAKDFTQKKGELLSFVFVERHMNLSLSYLIENPEESGSFGGIFSILCNTFLMIVLVLLIATPLGIGAALWLSFYAKKSNVTAIIRAGIDLLAGIPSIIFGLFGMLIFVRYLHWGFSLISGSFTLVLMVLPTIIKTSEESFFMVPKSLFFASSALGATKIETLYKVVLPGAKKGIVTGLILAVGRSLGETAALIFTIGSATDIASSLTSSARVLSQHIYISIIEGQSMDKAFAASLILIFLEVVINSATHHGLKKGFSHEK